MKGETSQPDFLLPNSRHALKFNNVFKQSLKQNLSQLTTSNVTPQRADSNLDLVSILDLVKLQV